MATVGHIYSGLPNKLFSIIVYYFLSQISLFSLIFSTSSASSAWFSMAVSYKSLLILPLNPAAFLMSLHQISAAQPFSFPLPFFSRTLETKLWCHVSQFPQSSHPLLRCVPPSLAQEIWVCSCQKPSSSSAPDTERPQRKTSGWMDLGNEPQTSQV